ncbi:MAG: sensor histidine kinase [Clostridia bacterium]|nr:sensor histidine kinase [Clostridia bacterium]NCC42168.1 sensor histidine kinase [Clostridia bacterium]
MKLKKNQIFIDTSAKLFIQSLILVFITVILTGGISLYLALSIRQDDMDTAIRNMSCMVSQLDMVKESLKNKETADNMLEGLDLLIKTSEQADVLVVCDTNSIRYYHTDHDRIGEKFRGDDQTKILEGGKPYISEAEGTLGMQRRAFYPVLDDDGTILGFVVSSVLTTSLSRIRNQIIGLFLAILLILLCVGALLSWISMRRIRKILLGYNPEEFRKIFLEHTEVMDALEEGILAINLKGEIMLMNQSAKRLLQISRGINVKGKLVLDVFPQSRLAEVIETQEEHLNYSSMIYDNQILLSDILIRKGKNVEGAVSVFRNKTEVTKLAEELTGARYMVDTLRSFNHEFMNKLHIILGLLEMKDYEGAKKYILNTSMVSGREVSHICQTIPVSNLAALLIGKLIRASELGITFNLKNDSYFSKKKRDLPVDSYITIVGNLVENAMDELNHADFTVKEIELGIYSEEGHTMITCDDTGGGIPEEILFSIYDRHTTTKGEGHGTGYARIREIVDYCEGTIHIDTEIGMGSSIEINLPI